MDVSELTRSLPLVMLSFVLYGCVTQTIRTTERYSPAFYSAEQKFQRVQILPLHMLMYRFEADGTLVPMTDQLAATAESLYSGLGEQLKSKGYSVIPPDSAGGEGFKIIDPALAQFEGPSFSLSKEIGLGWEADRERVQVNDFNFLKAVHEGPINDNVDAYLFVDYFAFHRVPGYYFDWSMAKRLPSWLGVMPGIFRVTQFENHVMAQGVVRTVLLDVKSGNLLWANSHDFGFKHTVHEENSWQPRVSASDSVSVTSALLQPIFTADQKRSSASSGSWRWQHKLSLEIVIAEDLKAHECALAPSVKQAFVEQALEQSISVAEPAVNIPHLVLRVDDIREGHFAKADTNISMTALLYQNEGLRGNLKLKENVNIWQAYDLLCGRVESAAGRSFEPLWDWLAAPTWSPWIK